MLVSFETAATAVLEDLAIPHRRCLELPLISPLFVVLYGPVRPNDDLTVDALRHCGGNRVLLVVVVVVVATY